jgi:hypothetical protein
MPRGEEGIRSVFLRKNLPNGPSQLSQGVENKRGIPAPCGQELQKFEVNPVRKGRASILP